MASKVKVNTVETESGSTLTLGQSGDTVTLASGASQSGFGRTGTVDWDTTAKTANFTAVSGNGYFVNTTSGAITVTLPAGSAGAIIAIADYANTFNTNNLTITPQSGEKIGGITGNAFLITEGISSTFVYIDSTQGWKQVNDATSNIRAETFLTATGGTETTCGDYKIHTFTGPGTFTVCSVADTPTNNVVDYLVVAAGGGGGSGGSRSGGGGGAGGFRFYANPTNNPQGCNPGSPLNGPAGITVTATSYPITVGSGGTGGPGGPGPESQGNPGSNSSFSTITSTGGGGGGGENPGNGPGLPGGSGGGAANSEQDTAPNPAGSGNTPPVSPSQGNNGGSDGGPDGNPNGGGGGGGAIAAGTNPSSPKSNPGGAGAGLTGFGSGNGECSSCVQYFSGGGGGIGGPANCTTSNGGLGGGGDGNSPGNVNGTANTGGGGGSTNQGSPGGGAGTGGSGIVVIRYKYQ